MDGAIDWDALFVPSLHLGEIVLRGSAVYLFLFFLLRMLRREAGHIGISDMVVVVLIRESFRIESTGERIAGFFMLTAVGVQAPIDQRHRLE